MSGRDTNGGPQAQRPASAGEADLDMLRLFRDGKAESGEDTSALDEAIERQERFIAECRTDAGSAMPTGTEAERRAGRKLTADDSQRMEIRSNPRRGVRHLAEYDAPRSNPHRQLVATYRVPPRQPDLRPRVTARPRGSGRPAGAGRARRGVGSRAGPSSDDDSGPSDEPGDLAAAAGLLAAAVTANGVDQRLQHGRAA